MLEKEEALAKEVAGRFEGVEPAVQRERRIWAEIPREKFLEVLAFLHDERDFIFLCTMTGLDSGDSYELIYYLADNTGIVFSAKESAPKDDAVFDTVTDIYKGGVLYELEARNLLGLTVRGIPDDIRYPLPDHWPEGEYPLRKDWKGLNQAEEPAADKTEPADREEKK